MWQNADCDTEGCTYQTLTPARPHCTTHQTRWYILFSCCFSFFFLPKQEQRLPNPAPVSVQLSSPHITHPGPTISSCKQEFKSSNHQVCESQPLEHAWNTQIIPGHWKTCKQCGREADIGSVVNTKVILLQGELRSTAPAGTRDTSPLPSHFSVHQSPGKVTKTINSGWHKSLTERIASVQNWTALHKIPSNC